MVCDVLGLDYSLVSGIPPSAAIGYKSSLSYRGAPGMQAYKHSLTPKFMLFVLLALLCSVNARAQVVIDVSKITCDQFATYKIENPKYIVIWLSGYYHGTRGDMTVDIQTLSADAKKVEGYCLSKPDVPLIQAVKTVLGISVGP